VAAELTGDEAIAGTPGYMAPEQLSGREVTQRSDIYSLGLVLYELFTGKPVFESKSIHDLIKLHQTSAPTSPSNHVKNLDPLVEKVILRCLEKDPSKRPATAIQIAAALPGGDPLAAALAAGETPSPEMVAASQTEVVISDNPTTTNLSAWYAGSTIFVLAICTGLILYGFYTSLAGQPLFRGELLNE
jgi:serine/threonine-protein kinase